MKPAQWTEKGFTFPPTEDKRCSQANCFTHDFEYSASNDQIKVLIKIFNLKDFYSKVQYHVYYILNNITF